MLNKNNGFTLIELIVGITIFVTLSIISAQYIIRGLKLTTYADEQEAAVTNTRKALNSMIGEIRESAEGDNSNYCLDVVLPQTLSFYTDINSDNSAEKIRYFIEGLDLKRGVIYASGTPAEYSAAYEEITTIAEYINNQNEAIFRYFDTDNNEVASSTADKDDIRLINVYLKVNVTPEVMPADYIMNMDIQLRNLKDNL